MGRIIKKDEQSDVTPASLDDELHDEPVPGSSESRIPAERVDPPEESEGSHGHAVSKEPILDPDQTRRTSEPVRVDPVEPADLEPDSPPADPSAEQAEDDESEQEDDADNAPPERTDSEWQERLEEARIEGYEEGYSDGYDDGYDEAEATVRAEWAEEREALVEDTTRFEEVWTEYIDEHEAQLVELTLQMAETIVDAPLTDSLRKASEEAIIEAVADLAGTPPLTITVHPVDFQRFQESGLAEHLTEKYDDLQLESDPERTEGDWTVASPAGAVRRRRSEVIDTLRSHLSLSAPAGDEAGSDEA